MFKKIAIAASLALALALPAFAATPVNINTADAETIAKSLDGIGLTKAQAIVAFREEHGPFKSADELAQVKGIGQATLERNHDAILLSSEAAKPGTPTPARSKPAKKAKPATSEASEQN